jgi:hypothetical protein
MGVRLPSSVFVFVAAGAIVFAATTPARAVCGCAMGLEPARPRDPGRPAAEGKPEIIIDNSRVALVRDGERTIMTLANDVRETDIRSFALLIPVPSVPTKADVRVADAGIFQDLESATRAYFNEVVDPELCPEPPAARAPMDDSPVPKLAAARPDVPRPRDYGVRVEQHIEVGEYDIAILSAKDSAGLIRWLRLFKLRRARGTRDPSSAAAEHDPNRRAAHGAEGIALEKTP